MKAIQIAFCGEDMPHNKLLSLFSRKSTNVCDAYENYKSQETNLYRPPEGSICYPVSIPLLEGIHLHRALRGEMIVYCPDLDDNSVSPFPQQQANLPSSKASSKFLV